MSWIFDIIVMFQPLGPPVGWLGFTACQPIGSFYAEYVFYLRTHIIYEQFFTNSNSCLFNP